MLHKLIRVALGGGHATCTKFSLTYIRTKIKAIEWLVDYKHAMRRNFNKNNCNLKENKMYFYISFLEAFWTNTSLTLYALQVMLSLVLSWKNTSLIYTNNHHEFPPLLEPPPSQSIPLKSTCFVVAWCSPIMVTLMTSRFRTFAFKFSLFSFRHLPSMETQWPGRSHDWL